MSAILIAFNFSRIVEGVRHVSNLPVRCNAAVFPVVFPIESEARREPGWIQMNLYAYCDIGNGIQFFSNLRIKLIIRDKSHQFVKI